MFSASAPGSIMLLGEHGVLHGGAAISASINKRITVTLTPNTSNTISIESTLGNFSCDKDNIPVVHPFTFILTALKPFSFSSGFTLRITSEFSETVGLGSSAAVVVATLKCISAWQDLAWSQKKLLQESISVIHAVQGLGSGADCAASVYEGVIYYKMQPCIVEKLPHKPTICLVYTGYKTKTADVIAFVATLYQQAPSLYNTLYQKINECAEQGKLCILKEDWKTLGDIFCQQQQLMEALGVSDNVSNTIIQNALKLDTVLGAKISGSGLGDCIVILGSLPQNFMENEIPGVILLHCVNLNQNAINICP